MGLPSYAEVMVFETVDECVEGTLRSSYERSGVCFGGFRLPARSRFGEGRPYEACGGAMGFSPWGLHFIRLRRRPRLRADPAYVAWGYFGGVGSASPCRHGLAFGAS